MTEHDPTGRNQHDPGAKLDAGKPRPALVLGGFSRALRAVTEVGTFGAAKYTDNGWQAVPDGPQRYTDAMLRHWLAHGWSVTDGKSGGGAGYSVNPTNGRRERLWLSPACIGSSQPSLLAAFHA